MWPGIEMVARVMIEERERKLARAEVMRTLRAEEEDVYSARDPFWGAVLVFAVVVIAFVGDVILA